MKGTEGKTPDAGGRKAFESLSVKTDEGKMTIKSEAVPLQRLLRAVAANTERRFVLSPDVRDREMSLFLRDVSVEEVLQSIMQSHDLRMEEVSGGQILLVSAEPEKPGASDLESRVVKLKYVQAPQVKATLEPLLTEHGTITVLDRSGFAGWGMATGQESSGSGDEGAGGQFAVGKRRKSGQKVEQSQWLVLQDTSENIKRLLSVVETLDKRPGQVLVSVKIVEVSRDKLKEIGVSMGSTGGPDSAVNNTWREDTNTDFALEGLLPTTEERGELRLLYQELTGQQFSALIQALQTEADAEMLSAPKLLVVDNQQASILVGKRFPILETERRGGDTVDTTTTLDFYQNIGIQLNVMAQIQDDNLINMIVHPSISEQTGTKEAKSAGGTTLTEFPIIETRETETQVLMRSGQTIAIGGLLKEVTRSEVKKVPVLGSMPLVGPLFRNTSDEKSKVDLIIFISAEIIRDYGEPSEETFRKLGKTGVRLTKNMLASADRLAEEGLYARAETMLKELLEKRKQDMPAKLRRRVQDRISALQASLKERESKSGAADPIRSEQEGKAANLRDERIAENLIEASNTLADKEMYEKAKRLLDKLLSRKDVDLEKSTRNRIRERIRRLEDRISEEAEQENTSQ